jgi:hypothetical protein
MWGGRRFPFTARQIVELSPRVWAIAYILLVPVAGLIFCLLPAGSFYDSNLIREAGYRSDIITVANILTKAVQRQKYGTETPGFELQDPTWKPYGKLLWIDRSLTAISPASVSVNALGNITLTIQGEAQSPAPSDSHGIRGVALFLPDSPDGPVNELATFGLTVTLSSPPRIRCHSLVALPLWVT